MYDIISSNDDAPTNDVSNRPSRSYVTTTPTAENVVSPSNVNGLPVATTESHTNGLPVDNLDLNSSCSGSDAELTDIGPSKPTELPDISLSEPSYNSLNSINGGSINRNINGNNYADISANGDVNNQSSHGHINELSDRLILRGVKHSLVQVDLSHVNNLPAYLGILTIGGVSYLVLPETILTNGFVNGSQLPVASMNEEVRNQSSHISSNEGFSTSTDGGFINRNINGNYGNTSANRDFNNQSSRNHTNESSDRLILRGVKCSLVQIDLSHANNLPTYTGTLVIYGVLYLVLPETIPTNGFVNGSNSHISANEGFQPLDTSTSSINGDFNSLSCEFSNGIPVNYYFTSQFSNSTNNYITDSDHILIGNSYPFQNNSHLD